MKKKTFAICINNQEHQASLEVRKLYEVVTDTTAAKRGFIRIIDESGEDYLYPAHMFDPIVLPEHVIRDVVLACAA